MQLCKKIITVCSVNWYSYDLLFKLFNNLNSKSHFPEKIKYLVIDNTNGKDDNLAWLYTLPLPIKIIHYNPQEKHGSFAHAAALNYALSIIDTEFTLITDPDVYIFKENWDQYMVQLIDRKKLYAIGTTFPEWQLGKFHNFPNAVFCLFKTEQFRKINATWSPYSKNKTVNLYQKIKRIILRFGIFVNRLRYQENIWIRCILKKWEQIIGVCSRDTGYKIAEKARENNFPSVVFDVYIVDRKFKSCYPKSMTNLAKHFELYHYDGCSILTHRYSTRSEVWQTPKGHEHGFWIKNIELYEKYLKNEEN